MGSRPAGCQQDNKREFWKRTAAGLSSEDAALACGASQPVGTRCFREAGGMAPISLLPHSGRYLLSDLPKFLVPSAIS